MKSLHPLCHGSACQGAHCRLRKGMVKGKIHLGYSGCGRKAPIVRRVISAQPANVVECSFFAAHHPFTGDEIGASGVLAFAFKRCVVETGRKCVDEVNIARELAMFLASHTRGNKDAQMANALMDRVDNGLSIGSDLVNILIQIEDPVERLRGRRDVVALRAKHHDWGSDIAKVHSNAFACLDCALGKMIANEQLIDNEWYLVGVEVDVAAPPAFEAKIA